MSAKTVTTWKEVDIVMNQQIIIELTSGTVFTWETGPLEAIALIEALAESLGAPLTITAGDVGPGRKEIIVEPVPEEAPEPIKVPTPEPVPA